MELSAASVGSGLTSGEVAERIAAGRVNRSLNNDWRTWAIIVRRNTLTLFNALVAPAALGLFLLGDYRGALAVGGMALTNSIIGLFHEFRTKWHLDRLTLLGEGSARVRRDGRVVTIPLGGVVEGDRVLVGSGDAVVADGTVMLAEYLELDEALLTGESDPVCREVGDQVRSGSVCIGGQGEYVAEKVGTEAFAERTASTARQYRHYPGPTQRTLEQLVGWISGHGLVANGRGNHHRHGAAGFDFANDSFASVGSGAVGYAWRDGPSVDGGGGACRCRCDLHG